MLRVNHAEVYLKQEQRGTTAPIVINTIISVGVAQILDQNAVFAVSH